MSSSYGPPCLRIARHRSAPFHSAGCRASDSHTRARRTCARHTWGRRTCARHIWGRRTYGHRTPWGPTAQHTPESHRMTCGPARHQAHHRRDRRQTGTPHCGRQSGRFRRHGSHWSSTAAYMSIARHVEVCYVHLHHPAGCLRHGGTHQICPRMGAAVSKDNNRKGDSLRQGWGHRTRR